MQKKDYDSTHSEWQEKLDKEKKKKLTQKFILWGLVALVTIISIAGLVKLSGGTTSTEPQIVENIPKPTETDIIVGNKSAKVTLIEYSDFQCPACASYNSVVSQILSDYQGKVNLAYRFFPLTSIHKNALVSAQAGYAAWKLGKFSEMKDELFNNQGKWESLSEDEAKKAFTEYAVGIKLNEAEFTKIMNSDEAKDAVLKGEKESLGLGLQGTPSFFIGNKKISVAGYDGFKQAIDSELNVTKPLK